MKKKPLRKGWTLAKSWQNSGKSITEWAKTHDIPVNTLRYWIAKIKKEGSSTPLFEVDDFIELKNEPSSRPEIEIRFRDFVVLIPSHFNEKALQKCMDTLRRCAC